MGKSVAAMVMSFIVGGVAMGLLSSVIGLHAESAALGLVGVGLIGSSVALGKLSGSSASAQSPAQAQKA
ncbi:MAG: hypothetical protein ACJ790_15445 [Myxococcaceae bacterium]